VDSGVARRVCHVEGAGLHLTALAGDLLGRLKEEMLKSVFGLNFGFFGKNPYKKIDDFYVALDKKRIRRTNNIRLIPNINGRRGGKSSYAEWAHVIGIFQTLMYIHLDDRDDNQILDVGCGTGLLGIASEPFLGENGRYVGIDVMAPDIEFCKRHYDSSKFSFLHLDVNNPAYAPDQRVENAPWNIGSGKFDLVTALSVWTHFNEADALFYFAEVNRVLKPGGKAIITFFLLDERYEETLPLRSDQKGKYHMTPQNRWIFDQPAYGSDAWFHPQWAKVPEKAIGVKRDGLNRLISSTGLQKIAHYQGNWKEIPGVFFQDIVVFQKS
jgi:SAM-dependent methyltransferase